jgi:hypothetical protein
MDMLEMIIRSWKGAQGKGLPMGNQTSQLFALYYLDGIDRIIKEKFRIKYYMRYMDDMVILHHDKAYLQEILRNIRAACAEIKLGLNEKTQIFPIKNGVEYLGWHFYLTKEGRVIKRLRRQSKTKIKRRMRGYAAGRVSMEKIRNGVASTNGHLKHGDAWHFWRGIYSNMSFSNLGRNE